MGDPPNRRDGGPNLPSVEIAAAPCRDTLTPAALSLSARLQCLRIATVGQDGKMPVRHVMFRLIVLLTAVVVIAGSVDRQRRNDDPGYTGDDAEAGAQQGAHGTVAATSQGAQGAQNSAGTASTRSGDNAAPVGSSEAGQDQQGTTSAAQAAQAGPSEDDETELKVERTQWGPNIGTGENGELIKPAPGITIARPGQVGPIPGCYINDSGYMCCNNELEKILLGAQEELNKLDPGKSNCNTLRQAKHIQGRAQKYFGTDFETIVALDDFAFRTNFLGNMTCKVEVGGKYLLAYATPDRTKVDKFPIYEPTTPNPYFPPPPPLRTDYGAPPPPPSNYGPPPATNYGQPPPPPSQLYYQRRRNRWSN